MFKPSWLIALALLPIMTACTTHPLVADNAETLFTTNTQAAAVAFRSLRVENDANGAKTTIKGQIHRTGRNPVHFGHVDYTVLDANGKVRETGWVEHSAAIRLRNTHRPSLFSIGLKQPLVAGETVQLTYHTGSHA